MAEEDRQRVRHSQDRRRLVRAPDPGRTSPQPATCSIGRWRGAARTAPSASSTPTEWSRSLPAKCDRWARERQGGTVWPAAARPGRGLRRLASN